MKINILLTLILIPIFLSAQSKYDYNWLMGYNNSNFFPQDTAEIIRFDFNTSPVDIYLEGRTIELWRGAVLSSSHSSGDLAYLTNGCFITNSSDQVLVNGDSLNPGNIFNDFCPDNYPVVPQSILSLPSLVSDSLFYLYHFGLEYNRKSNPFYQSIIDLRDIDNVGEVTEKNSIIQYDSIFTGNLTAVKHANNESWWLIAVMPWSNRYNTFLFNEGVIETSFEQSLGPPHINGETGAGQSHFTPDGTQYIVFLPLSGLKIFDFDRLTGELSFVEAIPPPPQPPNAVASGGCAISSNSRFVYVSNYTEVYQYDLWANDISESKVLIDTFNNTFSPFAVNFMFMERAPDCRIYINSSSAVDRMHVILHPDRKGKSCELIQAGVELPAFHGASLSHFPNYRLDTNIPYCDSSIQIVTSARPVFARQDIPVKVFPNPFQETLTFEFPEVLAIPLTVELFDLMGRRVFTSVIPAGKDQISVTLPELSAGVYVYRLMGSDGREWKAGKVVRR